MSVLIETGKSTSKFDWLGWTWKMKYATFKWMKQDLGWHHLGEVSWRAMVDGYVIFHDDVNGRFEVVLTGRGARIIGETGSPLEAMRLARLDHRARLAQAEEMRSDHGIHYNQEGY